LKVDPTGKFSLANFKIMFLPEKDVEGNVIQFIGDKKQERIHVELTHKGEVLMDRYYSAREDDYFGYYASPIHLAHKNVNPDFTGYNAMLTGGEYTLKFFLDDRLMHVHDFEVVAHENDDAYARDGTLYQLEGAWSDYVGIGYAHFVERAGHSKDPEQPINAFYYTRNPHIYGSDRTNLTIKLTVEHEGKPFAMQNENATGSRQWESKEIVFGEADEQTSKIRYQHMKDGDYALRIEEVETGKIVTAEFSWKDGRFVSKGLQAKSPASPDYIEGGGNVVWSKLKTVKAAKVE
jgi:hypothetical protein